MAAKQLATKSQQLKSVTRSKVYSLKAGDVSTKPKSQNQASLVSSQRTLTGFLRDLKDTNDYKAQAFSSTQTLNQVPNL